MSPAAQEIPTPALDTNRQVSNFNNMMEAKDVLPGVISAKIMPKSGIKLHAISWSPDIKTRIAVINGSIVREGDRISRYLVHKINKDDILLSEDGELWKLDFRGQ